MTQQDGEVRERFPQRSVWFFLGSPGDLTQVVRLSCKHFYPTGSSLRPSHQPSCALLSKFCLGADIVRVGDVNLGQLVWAFPSGILHCVVTLFPCGMNISSRDAL